MSGRAKSPSSKGKPRRRRDDVVLPPPPTPPAADGSDASPRARMVLAAAELLGERGLSGTSFAEVIDRSGAPRGSIYHYFPSGKEALTEEALAVVGSQVQALFRHQAGDTPAALVRRVVAAWRGVLERSACKAGCAIAAVAHERIEHPELGARAAAVFVAWERELERTLVAMGMARAKASASAALILAALEGALMLCRARRELGPLDAVGDALATLLAP